MKKVNLTPEIVALLTKEAYRYIRAFSYPEIHDVIHREELVKKFDKVAFINSLTS